MSAPYYIDSSGILRGEKVRHAFLPEATTQPFITPTQTILHSQAGPRKTLWSSLVAYMKRADVTMECHFLVDMDGWITQTMPTNRRADCNYKANPRAISIETQDNGWPTLATTPWAPEQIDSIIWIVAAAGHRYGIPYSQPGTWMTPGVGHHSLFPEWSAYKGKTCPGTARIAQMDYVRWFAAQRCACEG
jgi:N-acetyl-anhydromuramyl-L-alanine amidase AmpD